MEIQLKELLQHDSPETRLLGCKLAYGNGYKMHQIFKEIKDFELTQSNVHIYGIRFYNVQLLKRVGDYFVVAGFTGLTDLTFNILHITSDFTADIVYNRRLFIQYTKQSSQRTALNKLKRSFMELVLK
jgi:hypothetical protein